MGLYGGQQDEDLEEDQEEVKLEEETYVNLSEAPRERSIQKISRRYFLQVELNARREKARFRGDPWAYICEEDWRRYFLQFL